ncbi:MAG: 6-phosphogluconolactonase [Parachlamydiaceae bacterium]|nr:6-phosphogluconolactonase [Parachlamydiaceae bacterium]
MKNIHNHQQIFSIDDRRELIIPGNLNETIQFCVNQFLEIGNQAIREKDFFTVALSGGSTPSAIFKELAKEGNREKIDWNKVLCFWSDERSVPPNNPENNCYSAMQSGLNQVPLLPEHIYRMQAEKNIQQNSLFYEKLIHEKVPNNRFDLIMLGMGEDGHTASLFPHTDALQVSDRLVIENEVPQKNTWRMTFTYPCINQAHHICIYVLGKNKAKMVREVLIDSENNFENLPIQKIGTEENKALWILDQEASSLLNEHPQKIND